MKRRALANLLQECLTGFDAGLSPEECLSAFPERRHELEPLFKQALSMRVAFAASPKPEFRGRLKENLMFAAGRDVSAALAREPDPDFVYRGRTSLLKAGGDAVQESLRAVPPPKLAFWVNAKRNLLEAAQQPPAPARQPLGTGLRSALSAAVVVLALSLAGLAYLTTMGSDPVSESALFDSLDQELTNLEEQAKAGVNIQPAVLSDLSRRTTDLVTQLEASGTDPLVERLPEIIQRQQEIVLAATEDSLSPELEEAQSQLNQAAEKVEEIRLAAALVTEEPEPTPDLSGTAAPASNGFDSTPTPEPEAEGLLPAGVVRVSALPDDATLGLSWQLIETRNLSLVIAADWRITVPDLDDEGLGSLDVSTVRADGTDVILLVQVDSGGMHAIVGEDVIVLRTEGPEGRLLGLGELVTLTGAPVPELSHVLDSFVATADLAP